MAITLLPQIARDEIAERTLHETPRLEHASRGLLVGPSLDCLRDERDPGVENSVFKTAKWLAEGHVTDNVKSGKVYDVICQPSMRCIRQSLCGRRWKAGCSLLNQSHMLAGCPVAANG